MDILGRGAEGSWGDDGWLRPTPAATVESRRSREVPNGTVLVEEALERWQRVGEIADPTYEKALEVMGEEGVRYVARQSLRLARSSNNLAGKVRRRGKLPALQHLARSAYQAALRGAQEE